MSRTIEAFATYHRQKELLTEYLQTAAAGLLLLRRNVDVPNDAALLGAFVDACDVKHWGKGKRYGKAVEKVDATRNALASQGVIQHVAAFDYFSRSLIQDLARFSKKARTANSSIDHDHSLLILSPAGRWVSGHCCNDIVGQLGRLSKRLSELQSWTGWMPSAKLMPTLPLFDLIRSVRNRIAHDDSVIGSELEQVGGSKEVADALLAFRQNYARRSLPGLPKFLRGRRVELDVVHAILFGAFLYEVAKELNAHATSLLDDGEFVDMAFYYSCVVDEHPFKTIRHKSAENLISRFVAERYLREDASLGVAVIARLTKQQLPDPSGRAKERTVWQVALQRFDALQKN